ncbi:ionotropic receptor 21a-like [Anabrus simplex]|uniref:ionotropic receptor 21a-like n=1 Tax=Anabrus simplex TaxID=316456 RepID=UPI0035A39F37
MQAGVNEMRMVLWMVVILLTSSRSSPCLLEFLDCMNNILLRYFGENISHFFVYVDTEFCPDQRSHISNDYNGVRRSRYQPCTEDCSSVGNWHSIWPLKEGEEKCALNSLVTQDIVLQSLHWKGPPLIIFKNSDEGSWKYSSVAWKADCYLLVFQSHKDLTEILALLTIHYSWNSQAHFLLILLTQPRSTEHQQQMVEAVLSTCWAHRMYNAIILLSSPHQTGFENAQDIYTTFPYFQEGCSGRKTILLDRCVKGRFINNTKLFQLKFPSDLYGCPVRFSTVDIPPYVIISNAKYTGIEMSLLNMIAEKMNFTPVPTTHRRPHDADWGTKHPNGTWTGLISDVFYNVADVTFGAIRYTPDRMEVSDSSVTFTEETMIWFLPAQKPIPRWEKLFRIFSTDVWVILLTEYLLISFIIYYVSAKLGVDRMRFTSSLIDCLLMIIGYSVHHKPTTSVLRILFFSWVFASLGINTAFQSCLVSFLTSAIYPPRITNLKDLLASNINIGVLQQLVFHFEDTSDSIMKMVTERYQLCPTLRECVERVIRDEDMAMPVIQSFASIRDSMNRVIRVYVNCVVSVVEDTT